MRLLVITIAICILPAGAWGWETESVRMDGSLTTYYVTGNRMLDDTTGVAGVNGRIKASVKISERAVLKLDASHPAAALSNDPASYSGLREAYISVDEGNVSVQLGKQIIVWGRADRFNPTDNLTPRDYRILSTDDDDQRFGTVAIQLKAFATQQLTLTTIALPAFRSSKIPLSMLPPGVPTYQKIDDYSSGSFQWAAKIDSSGDRLDWSLSYYSGFSLLPVVTFGNMLNPVLVNPPQRVIGADFAGVVGQWGIRGEVAFVKLEDPPTRLGIPPGSYTYTVLGVERKVWKDVMLNIQWLYRHVYDYQDPEQAAAPTPIALGNAAIHNQFDKRRHGVSVHVSKTWRNDSIHAEVAAAYFSERNEYAIRPKVAYTFSDHWDAMLLIDIYRGENNSYFGYLEKNRLAIGELRYRF